jgi:AcrR family transcriptional regulator
VQRQPSGSRSAPVSIRDEIVEVARRELASHGLASMTIRQVARGAGVDPGTVRHYFPAKDDLTQAAADSDVDLTPTYQHVTAEASSRGVKGAADALVVAAASQLSEGPAAEAAVVVCLTGGNYDRTVFGSFDRDVVRPVTQDLAVGGEEERVAMVMSTFLGFQLLATVLPEAPHTMQDPAVQAILAESIQAYLTA